MLLKTMYTCFVEERKTKKGSEIVCECDREGWSVVKHLHVW